MYPKNRPAKTQLPPNISSPSICDAFITYSSAVKTRLVGYKQSRQYSTWYPLKVGRIKHKKHPLVVGRYMLYMLNMLKYVKSQMAEVGSKHEARMEKIPQKTAKGTENQLVIMKTNVFLNHIPLKCLLPSVHWRVQALN